MVPVRERLPLTTPMPKGHSNRALDFVERHPLVTATTLVVLTGAALLSFGLRGGSPTTYIERKWEFVACTSTGGLAKYPYCNWQEPSDNAGSGVDILILYYTVGGTPGGTFNLDGTIGNSATISGATAITPFTNITASTGAKFEYIAGSLSGSIKVPEGDYLRLITLGSPGSSSSGVLMIEYVTRLSY